MTDKEKAKRFDEALKAAVVAHKDEDKHLKATLERIFPELKESEDEKIRKWIYGIIENLGLPADEDAEKELVKMQPLALAWLEKQGENEDKDIETKLSHAHFEGEIEGRDKVLSSPEKYGLQKIVDKVESNLLTVERAKEISPFMRSGFEQKSVWSEEDEEKINEIIDYLDYKGHKTDAEFLKSLIPQSTWKPSEEQLIQLSNASNGLYYNYETLLSLLEQLNKLREEYL